MVLRGWHRSRPPKNTQLGIRSFVPRSPLGNRSPLVVTSVEIEGRPGGSPGVSLVRARPLRKKESPHFNMGRPPQAHGRRSAPVSPQKRVDGDRSAMPRWAATLGAALCLLTAVEANDPSESGGEARGLASKVCREGDMSYVGMGEGISWAEGARPGWEGGGESSLAPEGGEAGSGRRVCGPEEHAVGRWVARAASERNPKTLEPQP